MAAMESLLMLMFLIKAKFRRKLVMMYLVLIFNIFLLIDSIVGHSLSPPSSSSCGDVLCIHGNCQEGRCVCERGWQGSACHRCGGRIKYVLKPSQSSSTL